VVALVLPADPDSGAFGFVDGLRVFGHAASIARQLFSLKCCSDVPIVLLVSVTRQSRSTTGGSMYQRIIREHLAKLGHIGRNPRHVEAWMRLEHRTFDALSPNQFRAEVDMAVSNMDECLDEDSEALARSFCLQSTSD